MNTALLRLARRHRDYPGVRVWFCSDGTRVAGVPGPFTRTSMWVVVGWLATGNRPLFYGYPTNWAGGDRSLRIRARELIEHDGCAPEPIGDDECGEPDTSRPRPEGEPDDQTVLEVIEEILGNTPGLIARIRRSDEPVSLADEKWVRIMCDYYADGVWAKNGGACGLDDLPISPPLLARLEAWQAWHDRECPFDGTPWPSIDAFSAEGEAIARAVKAELPDWTIVYHHEAKAKLGDRSKFEYEILLS